MRSHFRGEERGLRREERQLRRWLCSPWQPGCGPGVEPSSLRAGRRMTLHIWWLPSRRSLAETTVASLGLTVRHASGCLPLDRGWRDPLDRPRWPEVATEASAIRAAVGQPPAIDVDSATGRSHFG